MDNFYVGQEVVCLETFDLQTCLAFCVDQPVKDKIYTISEILTLPNVNTGINALSLKFKELNSNIHGYDRRAFRPLDELFNEEIEELKEVLTTELVS